MNEDIDVSIETREVEVEEPKCYLEIPQCCVEGWDSCPHVINKEPERVKKNIGL